jgi:hypothetical protein
MAKETNQLNQRQSFWLGDPTAEDLFDRDGGLRLGKDIPDAFEENTSTSCTVNMLAVSANHSLILTSAETGRDLYRRLGWPYFDNDKFLMNANERLHDGLSRRGDS